MCVRYIWNKCTLGLALGSIPKISHYVYAKIPKSRIGNTPGPILDKGFSTCNRFSWRIKVSKKYKHYVNHLLKFLSVAVPPALSTTSHYFSSLAREDMGTLQRWAEMGEGGRGSQPPVFPAVSFITRFRQRQQQLPFQTKWISFLSNVRIEINKISKYLLCRITQVVM